MSKVKQSWQKTQKTSLKMIPLVAGILLLISFLRPFLKRDFLLNFFQEKILLDAIIGSTVGSLSAGNPITSYIISGEFAQTGISLAAITAFLVAWVSVGVVQLPAESMYLGKKFALIRNFLGFISAILIGLIVHLVLV